MSRSDFHFEFSGETTYVPQELVQEAETWLRELAEDHTDLIGAAVTVEELTQVETPHFYRARIVAYVRPEDIAAINLDRTALASQLMLENGLDEEAAYYAADQILVAAQDRIDTERSLPSDVQRQ